MLHVVEWQLLWVMGGTDKVSAETVEAVFSWPPANCLNRLKEVQAKAIPFTSNGKSLFYSSYSK